jgi:hypothetical protein
MNPEKIVNINDENRIYFHQKSSFGYFIQFFGFTQQIFILAVLVVFN